MCSLKAFIRSRDISIHFLYNTTDNPPTNNNTKSNVKTNHRQGVIKTSTHQRNYGLVERIRRNCRRLQKSNFDSILIDITN